MRSGAEGSSANSKQSDQPFMHYLIGYKNLGAELVFVANQIMHEWLIGLLRIDRGPP